VPSSGISVDVLIMDMTLGCEKVLIGSERNVDGTAEEAHQGVSLRPLRG